MAYVCPTCNNTGTVCENHPNLPWAGIDVSIHACDCGPGIPCPDCCDPVPQFAGRSIHDAFRPRHLRG